MHAGDHLDGAHSELQAVLAGYQPRSLDEAQDVEQMRRIAVAADPWTRSSPIHVTGSALVLHPETRRVLLRWHERMRGWLQVGGHADPGESDPYQIALREAREETGLLDLRPWPDPAQPLAIHIAIVPVPAGKGEAAHQHADVRFVLATRTPETVMPESTTARLEWLTLDDALLRVGEDNLRIALSRVAALLAAA